MQMPGRSAVLEVSRPSKTNKEQESPEVVGTRKLVLAEMSHNVLKCHGPGTFFMGPTPFLTGAGCSDVIPSGRAFGLARWMERHEVREVH